MKTLFLLLAAAVASAEDAPAPAARPPENMPSAEEIQTMRKLLELPPERLARIRGALERLERMPPESRREFAANLAKFENATPEERRKIAKEMRERVGFSGRLLEHYFKSLPPERVRPERERILALPPEKRQEFIRQLAERFGPEIAKERAEKAKGDTKDAERPSPKRRRADDPAPAAKPEQPQG